MPWCGTCSKFYNPNSAAADGTCPSCGRTLDVADQARERTRVPWHFWVLVAATGGYLGWRAIQGLQSLIDLL